MKNVLLSGCHGKMGQVLQKLITAHPDLQVVAGLDHTLDKEADFPVYAAAADVVEKIDIVIDFSHYSAVPALINSCVAKNLPIVIATTGLTDDTKAMLPVASQIIPVFYSANMSLGINVLIKALQSVAPALENDFNIEIIEKHHNQKKDAPSGTALLLADSINDSLTKPKDYLFGRAGNDLENPLSQMGIHAIRGGSIPGEHTVIFAGSNEILEFTHTALSRDIFANGALKAAEFLLKQSAGLYSMQDLLA